MVTDPYIVIGTLATRTFRVVWALEEMGLTYRFEKHRPHSDEILKYNPGGKVPVLIVDKQPITDSTAILQFLADRHGSMTYHAGTIERARQDAMTQFLNDEFDAVLWAATRHRITLPEERRVPEVIESLKWEFQNNLKVFEEKLGDSPFVTGSVMTVPDIIATHCLNWAHNAGFGVETPLARAYLDRMRARPAWQKVREMARA